MTVHRAVWFPLVALLIVPCAAAGQEAAKPKTLYERLGGYDMIAKIVDDFGPKLGKDPEIAPLVASLSMSSRMRNRQLIVDQICQMTGGPCLYIGRPMPAAHQGLGITEDHWARAGKLMTETLDSLKIAEPEKAEFLALIDTLKPDIIEKKREEAAAAPAGTTP
jgi:hemoglobin